MQGTQHGDRFDGRQGKFRRHIRGYAGKPKHLDVQFLPGRSGRLQIRAREVAETELQRMPHNRFLDFLFMGRKPVADRGPNEVGTVGIEAFLDQQIDVAEVDVTKVDRDLFRLARSVAEPMNLGGYDDSSTIYLDGI